MTDHAELIAMLREVVESGMATTYDDDLNAAADALSALVAERDRYKSALEYLAADVEAAHVSGALNSPPPTEHERANLARARAALAQGGEKP
jgi:hypothetical protein